MNGTIPSQGKILLRVRQGKKEHPEYAPFLDFWEKILSVQLSFLTKIKVEEKEFPGSLISQKLKEGFPLLSWKTVPVEESLFKEIFTAFCRAIRKSNPKFEAEIPKIEKWLEDNGQTFSTWLNLFLREEGKSFLQKAAERGLDAEVMIFLFISSWKPFLKARSAILAPRLAQNRYEWARGYCPICGSSPLWSFFKEDGKRAAVCSVCDTVWPIPRLFCPNCNNTDQKTLHYFFVQGDEGNRIEVCDVCRHYLKTLDLGKKGGDPIPVLEDLLTTHLDLWAQKKGYKKLPLFGKLIGGKPSNEDPFQGLAGKG
jgi:FdhE protein